MKLDRYAFTKEKGMFYVFYSEGPKGRIRKVIEYSRLPGIKSEAYNLSFGDWDEVRFKMNDKAVSNNADRDKVLATVGATVIDFIQSHPDAFVFAQGSTEARTRLYQMSINRLWNEINTKFVVRGFVNSKWEELKPGINYTAFLLELR